MIVSVMFDREVVFVLPLDSLSVSGQVCVQVTDQVYSSVDHWSQTGQELCSALFACCHKCTVQYGMIFEGNLGQAYRELSV